MQQRQIKSTKYLNGIRIPRRKGFITLKRLGLTTD
jgi:hypothetical protein